MVKTSSIYNLWTLAAECRIDSDYQINLVVETYIHVGFGDNLGMGWNSVAGLYLATLSFHFGKAPINSDRAGPQANDLVESVL